MRLGEKEFTDLMGPYGQSIFMKREYELKTAHDQSQTAQAPDKSKHSALEISQKWAMIRVMRDLDVDRLTGRKGGKIVTQ